MNHKILVVDDEPEIRELIRRSLTRLGYKVATAESSVQAVEIVSRGGFSLVICDIMMPQENGLETLHKIRKIDKKLPVIMTSGFGTHDLVIQALEKGANDFIAKPISFLQMHNIIKKILTPLSEPPEEYSSPVIHLMREGYLVLLNMINKLMELKNPYIKDHANKVAVYSTKIAQALKLPESNIEVIHYAAILHDIGKIGISDNILLKPLELNEDEWTNVKTHPVIGRDMLDHLKLFRAEEPMIYHHHEWFDGSGYPSGLKSHDIPLGARIISIADAYDALISNRPYRRAMNIKTAREIIRKNGGSQFDLEIIGVFESII